MFSFGHRKKKTKFTTLNVLLLSQQVFTAVKTAISHLKEHRIYFPEKQTVFMEANKI